MRRLRVSSHCALLILSSTAFACAQPFEDGQTVRHHSVPVSEGSPASDLLDQAETLLGKGDFASAEPILQQATVKDPKSYQAWYDFGYTEQALKHDSEAIAAYQKSVEINPGIFESNLNLGLSLAAVGKRDEAIKYLKAATELQPSAHPEQAKEHAWLALGRLEMTTDATEAEKSLSQAASLVAADPAPHLLLAQLDENAGKLSDAQAEYQQALTRAQGPERIQALRGLVNVAITSGKLDQAEANIRQYLAAAPSDHQAHLLLGRLLAAQGKDDAALAELNQAGDENDPGALRERADLLVAVKRDSEALPLYQRLIAQNGNDAQLRYSYGRALLQAKQFAAAQEQLLATVKLNPNLATAYGDLAVAANDNQQYDLTLRALAVRTKLLGDNPGTYFLRATALDHLRRYPEATQNYRQFLAVSAGKFPDEEWKARHRLLAIQNLK